MKEIILYKPVDSLLLLIYLIFFLLFFIVKFYKHRNTKFGLYLWIALTLKIFFSLISLAIAINVYGDGDTFEYYRGASRLHQAFHDDFINGVDLVLENPLEFDESELKYARGSWLKRESSVSVICKIGGIISLFTFNSYPVISMFCSLLAFYGTYLIVISYAKIYPYAKKYLAVVLFIPSLSFWAAQLSKDSIAVFALGIAHYYFFEMIYQRRRRLFYILLGSATLFLVKSYIIFIYLVSLIASLFIAYRVRIKENWMKIISKIFIFLFSSTAIVTLLLLAQGKSQFLGKLDIERVFGISENIISAATIGGVPYKIYGFNWTPQGVLLGMLQALNVTFFRPFLWEVKKVLLIPSAIESFILTIITVYCFVKTKFFANFQKYINKESPLIFTIVFSLFFGVVSGLFSFNFGTLVRYKIPAMIFFVSFLAIIYSKYFYFKKIAKYQS